MAYLLNSTLEAFRYLEAHWEQSDIPCSVRIAFLIDGVQLIFDRLPTAVRKEFQAIRKLDLEVTSKTQRNIIRKRCKAWIQTRQAQQGGWEKGEVYAMQAVIDILDEVEREDREVWTGHFQEFLAGLLLSIDESLSPRIDALVQKHFGPYFRLANG